MLAINRENLRSFPNGEWRKLITFVCDKIDIMQSGLQIISPFGFELMEDKKYLYKSIKRLYCYIGVPKKIAHLRDLKMISKIFSKELMSSIHRIGIAPSDIAIFAAQDEFIFLHEKNYECRDSDFLIDAQVRVVDKNILDDYAHYIICTVDSISSNKEEPEHFFNNKRHRSRTYQLYVVI